MKTIQTTGTVTHDGVLTVKMPPSIQPGKHKIVVVIDEKSQNEIKSAKTMVLPVDHLGSWPTDMSLRREDFYGNDQR